MSIINIVVKKKEDIIYNSIYRTFNYKQKESLIMGIKIVVTSGE